MKNVVLCLLLILLVLFNTLAVSYDTYANPFIYPVLLVGSEFLGIEALAGASCLFATQGVTFKDSKSSSLCMADFFNNMPNAMIQGYKANFANRLYLTKSTIKFAPDLWEYTQNYINSLQIGESIRKALDFSVGSDGVITQHPIAGSIYNPYLVCGQPAYCEFIGEHGAKIILPAGVDGLYHVEYTPWLDSGVTYIFNYLGSSLYSSTMTTKTWDISFVLNGSDGDILFFGSRITLTGTGEIGAVVTGGIEDDYFDYTRSGVAIPVPQTQEGDRVITVPKSVPLTGGVDIVGDLCIPSVNVLTDANTYTDATTGELDTAEFRYPEMQVPADVLKNKFPFSIPWDLKNAVTSLAVAPSAPKWEIKFDSRYFVGGGEFVIDFTQFELWAKIIRWGILVTFNIFLILATRRLVGAS